MYLSMHTAGNGALFSVAELYTVHNVHNYVHGAVATSALYSDAVNTVHRMQL